MNGKKVAGTKMKAKAKASKTAKAPAGATKTTRASKAKMPGKAKKTAVAKPVMKQFAFSPDLLKNIRAQAKTEGIAPKAWLEGIISKALGTVKAQ